MAKLKYPYIVNVGHTVSGKEINSRFSTLKDASDYCNRVFERFNKILEIRHKSTTKGETK